MMDNTLSLPVSAGTKLNELRSILNGAGRLLIAYSGGVDSTFLLAEAADTLGDAAVGVLADSPSLPRTAFHRAIDTAKAFGAIVEVIATTELEDPRYSSNPSNRCYFCKFELFSRMQKIAVTRGFSAVAYGENADDAFQVRPGAEAAREFRVLAPLRMAGLTKSEIRFLSRERGLPTADIPAQPCLSSRIPHGTTVTRDALRMIEQAEEFVRSCGFIVFRVRYIAAGTGSPSAKLEIDPAENEKLLPLEATIREALRAIGFRNLLIDPKGYSAPPQVDARYVP
jgi:pyridinium-3,5-biscarboxylic acid mononucleotide sulfurtransferase